MTISVTNPSVRSEVRSDDSSQRCHGSSRPPSHAGNNVPRSTFVQASPNAWRVRIRRPARRSTATAKAHAPERFTFITSPVILDGVLQSFSDKDTERVWQRRPSKRLDQQTQRAALRKLLILDAADELGDLRVPPGNRLEKLRGDRAGSYSIRINDQWRICFRWTAAGPEGVEIVDYH